MRRSWFASEDARLAEIITAGGSWGDACEALGRSFGAVRSRAGQLGLTLSAERRALAPKLAAVTRNAKPDARANHVAACRRRVRGPAEIERLRGMMRRAREIQLADPAACQRRKDAIAASARARAVKALEWCPPHLVPAYRTLVKRKGVPAVEARAMLEEDIAREARREAVKARRAAAETAVLTKYERDLAAAQAGTLQFYDRGLRAPEMVGA